MLLRDVLSTFFLGVTLVGAGCGGEASLGEGDELTGSSAQELVRRDKPEEEEKPEQRPARFVELVREFSAQGSPPSAPSLGRALPGRW